MAAYHKWRGPQVLAKMQEGIARALNTSAVIIQRETKLQLSTSKSPSAPGTPPGVRTGHLRRSWQMGSPGSVYHRDRIRASINPNVKVGSNVKYARIHEYGGVITAKKAKYLTIPLNKRAEKMLIAAGGSVRGIPGLFRMGKVTGKSGGVLAIRTGKRKGKVIPLFALKRSVRIPMRPYIRPAVAKARPRIVAAFQQILNPRPAQLNGEAWR